MHLPGARPADVPFLFEQQPRRLGLSLAASLCFDIAAILLVVLVSRPGSRTVRRFPAIHPAATIAHY